MFRLISNPDSSPNTFVFDADVIVLGHSEEGKVDFLLLDSTLEEKHLRILATPEGYLIENTAQDPFATVNDLPFGKKRLASGDRIHVGSLTLLFEEGIKAVLEPSEKVLEEKIEVLPIGHTPRLVEKKSPVFVGSIVLLCLLSLFSLLKAGVDFLEREREAEEHIAIQVVADTTMALAFAKIHEIGKDRQIFSDPHFMEKSLSAVLGKTDSYAVGVDAQGRFKEIPYILRIYTSPDLGQFLVMAQPMATLFNWFTPKGSFVVDSSLMDLRKVEKIKELNRLLVYLNAPEEGNTYAERVTDFLKEQQQVSLLELGNKNPGKGYSPPQELSHVKPGAENYIYNAPRYYLFTNPVVREVSNLLEGSFGKSVSQLKGVLENFSFFKDTVFYTTQGSTHARQLKSALKMWMDQDFFVSTLFLTEEGEFLSQALVLDDTPTHLVQSKFAEDEVAFELMSNSYVTVNEEAVCEVDIESPLFLKMRQIAIAREEVLTPISEEIVSLIQVESRSATLNFWSALKTLLNRYKELSLERQQIAINDVANLYQEYSFMPFADFFAYAKKAEIEGYLLENQRIQEKLGCRDVLSVEEFQHLLDIVHESKNGFELESALIDLKNLLTIHSVPNIDDLIIYQKRAQIETIEKLKTLMAEGMIDEETNQRVSHLVWIGN